MVADTHSRARRETGGLGALALRTLFPALYGAVLMAHKFSSEASPRPWVLGAVVAFIAHFVWRIQSVVTGPPAQDVDRVEVGLLAMLALATALELTAQRFPWPTAAYGVLLVSLSGTVPLPGILALPLVTIFSSIGGKSWSADFLRWLPDLVQLELLAAAAGCLLAVEKRRAHRLRMALEKLKLDAEHLEARAEGTGSGKKGDLSRLDDVLYSYLQEVKENAGAHGAALALRTPKGDLYIRELVSDSHNIREEGVLSLSGTAFQWILRNQKPLIVGHLTDASARLGYYSGAVAVKSFVGVPLMAGTDVEGVLALDSLREEAFGDNHAAMLRVASHQVATILTQIRALEQVKREARDFKSLHDFSKRLGICNSVADLLDLVLSAIRERIQPEFSAAALVTAEGSLSIEATGTAEWAEIRGQSFDPGEGLAGWVVKSRQYLHYGDARERGRRPLFSKEIQVPEFPSILLFPLEAHGEALGALCLASASSRAFDSSAVAFCDILCQQTAQAMLQIQALQQLKELAATDSLTGLANRRAFFDRLDEEVRRARRYSQSVGLLILDVDHFKKINDRLGHQAGDEVLRGVAKALAGFGRDTDLVARYGGEEFALLLPNTDEAGARAVADRIRAGIEKLRVEWEGKPVGVKASLGVTAAEGDNDSAEAMIARADQSLYAAKETGRNRVISYSEIREYSSWKASGA